MDKARYMQLVIPVERVASPWLSFRGRIPRVAPRILFNCAFHSLAFYWILRAIFQPEGLSLYNVAITLLLLISLACFALVLVSYKRKPAWARVSYFGYYYLFLTSAWFLIVIVRGLEPNMERLFTLVANPRVGGVVWLLPLAAFIGTREGVFGSLMCVARVHLVVGCFLLIWFIFQWAAAGSSYSTDLYDIALALMYGIPLILLLDIGSKVDRYISYGALIVYIIGAFLLSRRAPCVIGIFFLVVSLCIGAKNSNRRIIRRILFIGFGVLLLGALFFDMVVANLPREWFIDTRSFLWQEIIDAFSTWDWIFGRGALGTYYSPYFQHELEMGRTGDWMVRQSIEVGYLFVALKAGLIGVALYFSGFVLTMWRASKLVDSRFGIGVLAYFAVQVAEGFVIGKPEFIMENIAQWILIGVVLSLPVRQRGVRTERLKIQRQLRRRFSPAFSGLRG